MDLDHETLDLIGCNVPAVIYPWLPRRTGDLSQILGKMELQKRLVETWFSDVWKLILEAI